jgi:hypothetical protein
MASRMSANELFAQANAKFVDEDYSGAVEVRKTFSVPMALLPPV